MGKNAGREKRQVERAIILAFIAALVMKIFIFDFMIAEGQSMVPAIKPGKMLLVCKVYYGIRLPVSGVYFIRWKKPRKGDVLVFYTPLGEIAVKRSVFPAGGETYPSDMFFALGDNGAHSYDSRNYGPVPNDNIIGKVLGVK